MNARKRAARRAVLQGLVQFWRQEAADAFPDADRMQYAQRLHAGYVRALRNLDHGQSEWAARLMADEARMLGEAA